MEGLNWTVKNNVTNIIKVTEYKDKAIVIKETFDLRQQRIIHDVIIDGELIVTTDDPVSAWSHVMEAMSAIDRALNNAPHNTPPTPPAPPTENGLGRRVATIVNNDRRSRQVTNTLVQNDEPTTPPPKQPTPPPIGKMLPLDTGDYNALNIDRATFKKTPSLVREPKEPETLDEPELVVEPIPQKPEPEVPKQTIKPAIMANPEELKPITDSLTESKRLVEKISEPPEDQIEPEPAVEPEIEIEEPMMLEPTAPTPPLEETQDLPLIEDVVVVELTNDDVVEEQEEQEVIVGRLLEEQPTPEEPTQDEPEILAPEIPEAFIQEEPIIKAYVEESPTPEDSTPEEPTQDEPETVAPVKESEPPAEEPTPMEFVIEVEQAEEEEQQEPILEVEQEEPIVEEQPEEEPEPTMSRNEAWDIILKVVYVRGPLRNKLSDTERVEVLGVGDGSGTLTHQDIMRLNEKQRWSHACNSSTEAIVAMAEHIATFPKAKKALGI